MIVSRHEMRRKGNEIWTKKLSLQTFKWPQGEGYQSCQLKHDENIVKGLDDESYEDLLL